LMTVDPEAVVAITGLIQHNFQAAMMIAGNIRTWAAGISVI